MSGIKIRGTGRCVPQHIVTNDDMAKIVETNDEWITTRTGIRHRHHCTGGENHTYLCTQAAKSALEKAGVRPEDIGACIVATLTADELVPAAACTLQRELGLPEDTLCFDLNAACTGFLFGLHTMECLLAASPRKYGLVLGAEVLSRILNWQDRGTCILFGDGAGAAVVEWNEAYPSLHGVLGCRGNREALLVPVSIPRTTLTSIWTARLCSASPWRPFPAAPRRWRTRPASLWTRWTALCSTRPTSGSSTLP